MPLVLAIGVTGSGRIPETSEFSTVCSVPCACVLLSYLKGFLRPQTNTSTRKHITAAMVPTPMIEKIGQTSVVSSADEPTVNSGSHSFSLRLRKWYVVRCCNIPDSCRLIILKKASGCITMVLHDFHDVWNHQQLDCVFRHKDNIKAQYY